MSKSNPYPPLNHTFTMGVNGMVASAHTLASSAGLNILADGGNAFDSAVTVGSILSVVEPDFPEDVLRDLSTRGTWLTR